LAVPSRGKKIDDLENNSPCFSPKNAPRGRDLTITPWGFLPVPFPRPIFFPPIFAQPENHLSSFDWNPCVEWATHLVAAEKEIRNIDFSVPHFFVGPVRRSLGVSSKIGVGEL